MHARANSILILYSWSDIIVNIYDHRPNWTMMMMMQLESMIGDDNSHQTTDQLNQLVIRTKNNLFKIVAHPL